MYIYVYLWKSRTDRVFFRRTVHARELFLPETNHYENTFCFLCLSIRYRGISVRDWVKLIFTILIKFDGRSVRFASYEKKEEKKEEKRSTDHGTTGDFYSLSGAGSTVVRISRCVERNRLPFWTFCDLDAVTFYIWNATCKYACSNHQSP